MKAKHTPSFHLRACCGLALESLEPRQLLTAYLGQSFADYFQLAHTVLDNIVPPAGAVYADFGASAAGLGDLDGDGYGDFAISAPGRLKADGSTDVAGAVFVFSGKTGSLIRTLSDGFAGFGTSIASLGDLNGDGKADLAVGSANFDPAGSTGTNHVGRAYVYSVADGAALQTFSGAGSADRLGTAVIGTDDVNADGVNDLAIGAPGAGVYGVGQVLVYSGATGGVLLTLKGENPGDDFGSAVFASGAVPGLMAGFPALVWVGAPGALDHAGSVFEFDAGTGAMNWRQNGDARGPYGSASVLGTAVVAVASGGGSSVDVFVGRPGQSVMISLSPPMAAVTGGVSVYRATTGALVREIRPEGQYLDLYFGSGLWLAGPSDVLVQQNRPGNAFVIERNGAGDPLPWNGRVLYLGGPDADGYYEVLTQPEGAVPMALGSAPSASVPTLATSSNEALTFVFFNAGIGEGSAIVNGRFLSYSRIPGLHADDDILGVNDSHLIVGNVRAGSPSTIFLVRDGVRTLLSDAVGSVQGGVPHYDHFAFVKVVNDGSVVFNESTPGSASAVWSFKNGVLRFVTGSATALDANNTGVILASVVTGSSPGLFEIFRPDGSTTVVGSFNSPWTPSRVSDSGVVAGIYWNFSTDRQDVAIWTNGQTTLLTSSLTVLPPPSGHPIHGPGWKVLGINGASQVLIALVHGSGIFNDYNLFLSDPTTGLHSLESITFGAYTHTGPSFDPPSVVLAADGRVLLPTGVAAPTADLSYLESASGEALSSAASTSTYLVIVNFSGDAVLFTRSGTSWSAARIVGLRLETAGIGQAVVRQTLVSTDPVTGEPTIYIVTRAGTWRVGRAGAWDPWHAETTPLSISSNATLFVSSDKRVHLAGIDTSGELILYYQTGVGNLWSSSNLINNIQAGGQTFVPVAGNLTSFAMPWGAMNIAYLDGTGSAQVVWWAPGLPDWRIDNLSQSAGYTGALHGTLVSYVTPWGGQNVAGTDASGNLVALWWAPGMATWRADRLVEGTPAQLDESTITAYVTPWGGLNIAGLDKTTGKLTAYWWVPGKPAWVVEEFTISGAPADLSLTGRLSSAVSPGGDVFIAAVTADHHLANIWFGAGNDYVWTFEDVTMAV